MLLQTAAPNILSADDQYPMLGAYGSTWQQRAASLLLCMHHCPTVSQHLIISSGLQEGCQNCLLVGRLALLALLALLIHYVILNLDFRESAASSAASAAAATCQWCNRMTQSKPIWRSARPLVLSSHTNYEQLNMLIMYVG
jgi:hypothetical protein